MTRTLTQRPVWVWKCDHCGPYGTGPLISLSQNPYRETGD